MNDAHFVEPRFLALVKIFFHNAGNIFWRKRVEIDRILYRKDNGVFERRIFRACWLRTHIEYR